MGLNTEECSSLYNLFHSPISAINCGDRCAPFNYRKTGETSGIPICCDQRHIIPTAFLNEWEYLKHHTDLWHLWEADEPEEFEALNRQLPSGQVLIACQGHVRCQREFRSIACRAFPFFPYITRQGGFIGLAYYWDYEDRCWLISNLSMVSEDYRRQFVAAYDDIFRKETQEIGQYFHYSSMMRRVFGRKKRAIPLLHRNGWVYKITPHNGRLRRAPIEGLSMYGPYKITAMLPFPEETGLTPD